uniref:Uncharacterized protein n=1 Tax=Oryza glumipatula TaxID=40148 RepID=A0A0E0B1L2_9ORYZ
MVSQVRPSVNQMETSDDAARQVITNTRNEGRMGPTGNTGLKCRKGRGLTINGTLAKLRARGVLLDIQFAAQFGKVCGRHASVFKSEVTVCVRQEVPLKVKKWKVIEKAFPGTMHASVFKSEVTVCMRQEVPLKVKKWKVIEKAFPGTMSSIWNLLKAKFPEISMADYQCVMTQVERQYNCPSHVAPEDWQWLIDNLWSDEQFQKWSKQNSINRSKQEMKSHVGTKSIVQIAHELRNPVTGEWPSAIDVWKATYLKNGTWSVPNGEEILNNLQTAAETNQERIAAAQIPMVEHFALVLGRKPNHSRGVGISAINEGAQERYRVHAQAEAAQQQANEAHQQAAALLEEVQKLTVENLQLKGELQSQREELNSQKRTVEEQSGHMECLLDQKFEERMKAMWARMGGTGGASSSSAPNN